MKTVQKFLAVAGLMLFCLAMRPQTVAAQNFSVSFQVFYDQLSPYGTWVDDPNYGYVWMPNAGPDFQPYLTNGHWVYTEFGWTWISDYPWGWAPFHYGRWYYDPMYGSIWIPGNEWGPAWVTWRRANGYYGWAPLGPDVSIDLAFSNSYDVPYNRWIFVRDRYLYRNDLDRYYVNNSNNTTIINNSTIINNTYIDNSRNVKYIAGPDRREVQRVTGRDIRPYRIQDENSPGQSVVKDRVQIYRPRVEPRAGDNQRTAPPRVVSYRDVKPAVRRNAVSQGEVKTTINPDQGIPRREQVRQEQKDLNNRKVEPRGNNRLETEKTNPPQEKVRQEQQPQQDQRQKQIRLEQQQNDQRQQRRQSDVNQNNQRQQQMQQRQQRQNDTRQQRIEQPDKRQQKVTEQRNEPPKVQAPTRRQIRQQNRQQRMEINRQQKSPSENKERK